MSETLTDRNLISNYLKGDEKSLEILISRYLKLIYNFVYKNVGSEANAEDITQEVFVKVWKNLKKFDQNKSFKPWIFQIAKNTSIDFLRKRKTIPFSNFENDKGQNPLVENIASAPSNLMESLSDKKILASVMQNLPDKEKRLLELRHYEGMSFREISERLKESANTIKSRYRRSIINLRNKIKAPK